MRRRRELRRRRRHRRALAARYDRARHAIRRRLRILGGEVPLEAARVLSDFDAPGAKIIVLATDGEPDTCEEPNPQNGGPAAIAAASTAFSAGIHTYVLSVGGDVRSAQQMANAGAGLPVDLPPG